MTLGRWPTIPKIQKELHGLADALLLPNLFPRDNIEIGTRLREMTIKLSRRPRVTQAPVASRPCTAEVKRQIREFHARNPDMTQQAIGEAFGVLSARVSETLGGKRK